MLWNNTKKSKESDKIHSVILLRYPPDVSVISLTSVKLVLM